MKTKFKTQRKGAVLMTVLVVSTMMVVIVGAAISLVAHTNYETNKEYRKKQAYFAASSTLEAFVTEVTRYSTSAGYTTSEIENEIKRLQNLADGKPTKAITISKINPGGGYGGDITDDNIRWKDVSVSLKLEKVGDSNKSLKAISTATYLGQRKTVVAYLTIGDLNKRKTVLNALEMLSANGGMQYNNIEVYGSTAAPDFSTHEENTVYDFRVNNNKFYGDISIYGSMVSGVHMKLSPNPYYFTKEYDPDASADEDEENPYTPGCTLRVSRSFIMANNAPDLSSTLVKTLENDKFNVSVNSEGGRNFFNFVDVREALVMSATSGAVIGAPGTMTPAVRGGLEYIDYTDPAYPGGKVLPDPTARMVDVYTSLLVMGNAPAFLPQVVDWCASTAADPAAYKSAVGTMQNGNQARIYGNVYTYADSPTFNGDIYLIGIDNAIYGDIYCSGNIYVKPGSGGSAEYNGLDAIKGQVHFPDGDLDEDGNAKSHDIINIDNPSQKFTSDLQASGKVVFDNWKNEPRAQRPYALDNFDAENEHALVPYYYYPEHLLCEPAISTIWQTYKAMYGTGSNVSDKDGTNDFITKTRYRRNGSSFVEDVNGEYIYDNGVYIDVSTKYADWGGWTATQYGDHFKDENGNYIPESNVNPYNYTTYSDYKNMTSKSGNTLTYTGYDKYGSPKTCTVNNNTYSHTYTDVSGNKHDETLIPKDFNPECVITGSCILDTEMKDVLIDLDNAKPNEDGKYDIVIMMNADKSFTDTNGPYRILVKNFDHPTEGDEPRFVYFVSDSGVGTTNDEYGEKKEPSTYSKFKTGKSFETSGKMIIMNLADYCHSKEQGASPENSLDPTGRPLSIPAYNVESGGIFFLLTKGMRLKFDQETIIQANIFMPEARFMFRNNGRSANIEPSYSVWGDGSIMVNILGSLSCGQYEPSANNNTIVYLPASSKSMLAFVHGAPDEAATESFHLERYASA